MNKTETNSGGAARPYRIQQKHLGRIGDDETIEDVERTCEFAGGDYAIELRGETLHMFRVTTGVSA